MIRILGSSDLSLDVLVSQGALKIFEHRLLLIRLDYELFDVLREHGQPLIFLRVSQSSIEFNVLRIDNKRLLAARPATTCIGLTALSSRALLLLLLNLLVPLGISMQVGRAQHLILLR